MDTIKAHHSYEAGRLPRGQSKTNSECLIENPAQVSEF